MIVRNVACAWNVMIKLWSAVSRLEKREVQPAIVFVRDAVRGNIVRGDVRLANVNRSQTN
jgi:hypothetical protein